MSKVKIQGHASGTGVLTVTAPNTSTDRTITLPDGTGTLIADDGSGNVGIGTTPESWRATTTALEVGGNGNINTYTTEQAGNHLQLMMNGYHNGTEWKYKSTDEASRYMQKNGTHTFSTAASGSADSAITFSTKATIDTDGLKFNGDTSADNALSDYEEGTWTPTFVASDGANNPTISYTANSGFYTKVGNLVTININTNTSSVSGGGSGSAYRLRINGLPFAGSDTSRPHATGIGLTHWGSITTDESLVIQVNTGTQLQLNYAHDGADVYTDALRTSSDSNQIKLSLTYATDS